MFAWPLIKALIWCCCTMMIGSSLRSIYSTCKNPICAPAAKCSTWPVRWSAKVCCRFVFWRREKLQDAPLREKLNQILALGIWCVLLLFFLVITLWQASQTLYATQAEAKSLAELAAESNAAALSFDDRAGAQKQLKFSATSKKWKRWTFTPVHRVRRCLPTTRCAQTV
jgi:hypothetical protein